MTDPAVEAAKMNKDFVTRVWRKLVAHGLGWIDNGTEKARCYCGHYGRLGESWHYHVADVVIRELVEHRRSELVQFATWLLKEEPGEGREKQLVDE